MLLEWQKGKDSFWKQYLDSMPSVRFFCHWSDEDIVAVQDQSLIIGTKEYKEDIEYQWGLFRECMLKHPEVFEERTIDYEIFMKLYGQVGTRCFNIGNDMYAMVPMADNYNHSHFAVEYMVISK